MFEKKIFFQYEQQRAFQAVLWLLNRHGCKLNKMKILKLIYLADKAHLLKYGRPIAGGDYYAMKLGPVCSMLLNDLDGSVNGCFPFQLQGLDVVANTGFNESYLSESDIEILMGIDKEFGEMDRFRLSNYTHGLPEYKKVWPEGKQDGRKELSYESIIGNNKAMMEIINDNQSAWGMLN